MSARVVKARVSAVNAAICVRIDGELLLIVLRSVCEFGSDCRGRIRVLH